MKTPISAGDYPSLAEILATCTRLGMEDAVRRNTPDSTKNLTKRIFTIYPGMEYYRRQINAFRMAYRAGFDGWEIVRIARSQIGAKAS